MGLGGGLVGCSRCGREGTRGLGRGACEEGRYAEMRDREQGRGSGAGEGGIGDVERRNRHRRDGFIHRCTRGAQGPG